MTPPLAEARGLLAYTFGEGWALGSVLWSCLLKAYVSLLKVNSPSRSFVTARKKNSGEF